MNPRCSKGLNQAEHQAASVGLLIRIGSLKLHPDVQTLLLHFQPLTYLPNIYISFRNCQKHTVPPSVCRRGASDFASSQRVQHFAFKAQFIFTRVVRVDSREAFCLMLSAARSPPSAAFEAFNGLFAQTDKALSLQMEACCLAFYLNKQ